MRIGKSQFDKTIIVQFITLYQLKSYRPYDLMRIPGIGETSAKGIYRVVGNIVAEVNANTRLVIDNERRSNTED